eukprot:356135-Chlamydomonas_euryale.AAC.10
MQDELQALEGSWSHPAALHPLLARVSRAEPLTIVGIGGTDVLHLGGLSAEARVPADAVGKQAAVGAWGFSGRRGLSCMHARCLGAT